MSADEVERKANVLGVSLKGRRGMVRVRERRERERAVYRSRRRTLGLSGEPGPGDRMIQSIPGSTSLWNSSLPLGTHQV